LNREISEKAFYANLRLTFWHGGAVRSGHEWFYRLPGWTTVAAVERQTNECGVEYRSRHGDLSDLRHCVNLRMRQSGLVFPVLAAAR
jgi:hypothetical protein